MIQQPSLVVGYARVSTRSEDQDKSIPKQEKAIRDYIAREFADSGIDPQSVQVFSEKVSASKLFRDRRMGKAILETILHHRQQAQFRRTRVIIVSTAADRALRSSLDSALLTDMLRGPNFKAEYHFIQTPHRNILKDISPEQELTNNALASADEAYRIVCRIKGRDAMKRRREEGQYLGSKPPFGYRLDDKRHLIEHEPEQEAISQIMNDYYGGKSYREIGKFFGFSHSKVGRIIKRYFEENPPSELAQEG